MKQTKWQVQDAKNKFSELVNLACEGTPQLVTRNGTPVVYVVDVKTYNEKSGNKDKKALLLNKPHKELDLFIKRELDTGREVEL